MKLGRGKKAYPAEQYCWLKAPALRRYLDLSYWHLEFWLHIQLKKFSREVRVLEVGPGQLSWRRGLGKNLIQWQTIDTDPELAGQVDFKSWSEVSGQQFDVIIATEVLEHCEDPQQLLQQMLAVLKAGGEILLSVPFAAREHQQPVDFQRWTSFGFGKLLEQSVPKNSTWQIVKAGGPGQVIVQKISYWLFVKVSTLGWAWPLWVITLFLHLGLNLPLAHLSQRRYGSDAEDYLHLLVLLRRQDKLA